MSKEDVKLYKKHAVSIPICTMSILDEYSVKLKLPIARLVAIAIDNELDAETPFNYPYKNQSGVDDNFMYAKEAGIISNFIKQFPNGIAVESIMLCRRQHGVIDRELLKMVYTELLHRGMIEEYKAHKNAFTPQGRIKVRIAEVPK